MVYRQQIDHIRLDSFQDSWYCTWCKVYHNNRVYIKVYENSYWLFTESLCESCKIKLFEAFRSTKHSDKPSLKEFTKKLWVFTLWRNLRIMWIISNEIVYKNLYLIE